MTTLKAPTGLISLGAIGYVAKVNDRIAVKTLRRDDKITRKQFAVELGIYDFLEAQTPICPDISRSFLRLPTANFLALCSGGSLFTRLHQHQSRNSDTDRLLKVNTTEPTELIELWIMELSSAVAWLESFGYAHTDIRPENLILDSDDHLKLTDFDTMVEIGTKFLGGPPAMGTLLRPRSRRPM